MVFLKDTPNLEKGKWAENLVSKYLKRRLWRICARNYTVKGGELDIVASKWKTLLIVEVRYRTAGDGLASIDKNKLERCIRAAKTLVYQHNLYNYKIRYDMISVDTNGKINRKKDVLNR